MFQRLGRDESGMTMGLAIVMILLISVMGAGLLTFVSRDLNSVVEENRGQRAFEVADAGIEAAKRQLASNVVTGDYNGEEPDIQWSLLNDGLTLEDLDGVDNTADQATVTIEYRAEKDDFRVISTGTYGELPQQSKRKIEAIFKARAAPSTGGGDGLGHPLYFTPSDIKIEDRVATGGNAPVKINKVSLFTEQDIIIEGTGYNGSNDRDVFIEDMNNRGGGTTHISGDIDELCDWDSDTPLPPTVIPDPTKPTETCFKNKTGTWNTIGRELNGQIYSRHNQEAQNQLRDHGTTFLYEGGFAAEGVVCGVLPPAAGRPEVNSCSGRGSVADGVYAYDSTTGDRGNRHTFVDKEPLEDGTYPENDPNTLSYPFPRPTPIPEGLLEAAVKGVEDDPATTTINEDNPATRCPTAAAVPNTKGCFYQGPPSPSFANGIWSKLFPSNARVDGKVVFIDAQNDPLPLNFNVNNSSGGQPYKGVLVVWCGNLVQQQDFDGIILNLRGDGFTYTDPDDGSTIQTSDCADDGSKGVYRNAGRSCKCWVYANGGTDSRAGIVVADGSTLWYPTHREWSFLNKAFETETPPTSYDILQSWRELYSDEE